MDGDDRPVGRLLTRREALSALGAAGAVALLRCSPSGSPRARASEAGTSPCVVRPEQTEGPYFVDELLNRSDVRSDPTSGEIRPGFPLELTFHVSRLEPGACAPLPGAYVDIWHCDHLGVYSDVRDPGFDTVGLKYLRGYQVTGGEGAARFVTIFPGWYGGRAVHVHFKIRSAPDVDPGYEFTSQLYFPDELVDRIHAVQPYAEKGPRDRRNPDDRIYRNGGSQLTLDPVDAGDRLTASFDVALQLS